MNAESVALLNENVKARVLRGEDIEQAVPSAVAELGIALDESTIEKIVAAFKLAMRQVLDPSFVRKQKALDARIRRLVKREHLSIARAVVQAQENTGVKLRPEGTKLLIQLLEEESEKMAGVLVEVVSDEEYRELCDPNWDAKDPPS